MKNKFIQRNATSYFSSTINILSTYSTNKAILFLLSITLIIQSSHAQVVSLQQIGDDIDGNAANDYFGSAVCLNGAGNIIAIGSPIDDGYIQVYEDVSGVWTQLGSDIVGSSSLDKLGKTIALNDAGDIVAVGLGDDYGGARVYEYVSGSAEWAQIGQNIDGDQSNGKCAGSDGSSLSINANGDIVAFGCYRYDGPTGQDSGMVRVFTYETASSTWVQLGNDIDATMAYEYVGSSVSLNDGGDIIAIGAYGNNNIGTYSGQIRMYQYDSSANDWQQLGTSVDGKAAQDKFGWTVSLNAAGDIVAASAHAAASSAGQTRIYGYDMGSSDDWSQIGSDIEGEAASDNSGNYLGLALNDDGDIIAIGATRHGNDYGQVRLFQLNDTLGDWNQIGDDIDGEAYYDHFGYSVALSNDGRIVAGGSKEHDGPSGTDSGYARIYEVMGLPTDNPTINPTLHPTTHPTLEPSADPTQNPSSTPTVPTLNPSADPTLEPTSNPTQSPTCEAVETECTETFTVHLDCNQDQKLLFGVIGFLGVLVIILLIMLCCCQRNKTGYVQIMKQLKQNNQINPAGDELLEA